MPPRTLFRKSRSRAASSRWMPESFRDMVLRFFARMAGGAVMLAAFLLALVLLSYNPADPSLNTASADAGVHNWFGVPGSYTADLFWQTVGFAGFMLPFVLAVWGWVIATQRGLDMIYWRALATVLTVLSFATALAVVEPYVAAEGARAWGGSFGKLAGVWLSHRIPGAGGAVFIVFVMAVLTFGGLYMASALTLGEWHELLSLMRRILHRALSRALGKLQEIWLFLRRRHRLVWGDGLDDDFDDEDEEGDEGKEEEKEDKPAPVRRARKSLVQRPRRPARQARLALSADDSHALPPLELLQWPESARQPHADVSEEALEKNAKMLESVLADFGVQGNITKVSPGPVVTLYELEPSPGTRASRVISLADDIARNMSAASVRVAVVPGRNVIGIELPNRQREMVYLRELLSSDAYADYTGSLPLVLGKDIAGSPVIADLARMPHLLIAGTTGSGKSVAINTMIMSLIYRLPPQKCRFIMVDPKMLELSVYEGIPHLLAPVVTDPKKAIMALKWTVREMEERYRAMSKLGVRNIEGYNIRLREAAKNNENLMRTVQTGFDRETGKPIYEEQPLDLTPLPYIVVIVDEMADLMIVAGKDLEAAVQRLAQMARAAGIHIIMATQRPSVDVITGTIKANLPTRISFQVTSKIDSRTILGEQGAEQLLGLGDMLYMAGGGRVTRVHGPFVRDDEVESIVRFLQAQGEPEYLEEVTEDDEEELLSMDEGASETGGNNDLYDKAVDLVLREQKASISFVQRHLQIGYNRAATIIERMEREGVIGSANHVGKREVLGRKQD